MIKKISKIYLNNWAAKDLVSLEELLSDDCILKDWEVELTSKKEILELNKNFFENNEIDLEIINLTQEEPYVYAHIVITINDQKFDVVDKLKFKNNKIVSIEAFKK